jgi:hypothetical protein
MIGEEKGLAKRRPLIFAFDFRTRTVGTMRMISAVFLALAVTPALTAVRAPLRRGVPPAPVVQYATSYSALARGGGKGSGNLTHEVLRGLAYEAPHELLDEIAERYSSTVWPMITAGSEDFDWSELFGPVSDAPEQVHLSVAESADPGFANVSVIWLTSTHVTSGQACIRPAGSVDPSWACTDAATWTYAPISELPWNGSIHGANFAVLTPDAEYDYKLGPANGPLVANQSLWSPVVTFRAPQLADVTRPLLFAFGGDMGTIQLVGYKVAAQMSAFDERLLSSTGRTFDAFWHLGDIAYSTLDPPKLNFEFFWDTYLRQEQSLANHVPLLVTYGNHDFSGGDSGAFINRFRMPERPGSNGNFYWAYTHGPIRYISICTEIALNPSECTYQPGTPQYVWIQHELASVNRSLTPWVIVAGHRPMYSSDASTDSGPLQEILEPLFVEYKVDVELAGHMHCTEFTAPVAFNKPNMSGVTNTTASQWVYASPVAPVHITAGALGAIIAERWVTPTPDWSMFRAGTLFSDSYGFVLLNATRDELHFTFLNEATGDLTWDLTVRK